jgi:hypothetical protein
MATLSSDIRQYFPGIADTDKSIGYQPTITYSN